jgi:hypothetical protein
MPPEFRKIRGAEPANVPELLTSEKVKDHRQSLRIINNFNDLDT